MCWTEYPPKTCFGNKQHYIDLFCLFYFLLLDCERESGQRGYYSDDHIISSVHVDQSFCLVQDFKMADTNSGDLCPKTDSLTLVNYVTTHSSGENLYECDQCKKTFDQAGSLKRHKLAHSGKKSHKCVQCSKSFAHASTLRLHMNIHTGVKLHKCAQCSN